VHLHPAPHPNGRDGDLSYGIAGGKMARVLWVSDAGRMTGFSRVTHAIAEPLAEMGHDVHVLAIGWDAKDAYTGPLKLYRSEAGPAHNYLGLDRMVELSKKIRPDVIVTLEDVPMVRRRFLENRFDRDRVVIANFPVISYVPIDAAAIPPSWVELGSSVTLVPMSVHGASLLGLPVRDVVYHGVDTETFHPVSVETPVATHLGTLSSKAECRRAFGIPEDAFVVGRVDTNSGRKDWGATWRSMDMAEKGRHAEDRSMTAVWHTKAVNYGHGIDLHELCRRGTGSFMITDADDWPNDQLVAFINTMDAFLTTSRGEGFGLTPLEAMACGVPVIATDAGSLPEVIGQGGITIPGIGFTTNPYGADLVIPDPVATAKAILGWLRADPADLERIGARAVQQARTFTWAPAIERFDQLITEKAQRPAS
jgi:glycosyltransferase involved in cell wall biosynthesis